MAKKKLSEKNQELEVALELKDSFATKRHKEQVFLTELRHKVAKEIIGIKDTVARKRHNERVDLIKMKFDE